MHQKYSAVRYNNNNNYNYNSNNNNSNNNNNNSTDTTNNNNCSSNNSNNRTLLETLKSYNLKDEKKQLVMFAILNYIFENIYTIKKHPNYMIAIKNYFTICEY